jgi:hypothetical protein
MVRQRHDRGRCCCHVCVSGSGDKTCKDAKSQDDWRMRATKRPLYFRLRSTQLVHGVYLRERPIDPRAVLALLPAKRLMPGAALLMADLAGALRLTARSRRSS